MRPRLLAAVAACALVSLGAPATASAASCSQQARVDRLLAFFDGWSRRDLTTMRLDRRDARAPFGTTLPRSTTRWSREQRRPVSRRLASVRAWLRRRVRAGDRVTLLRVQLGRPANGATGGTLSFRRAAPDIRHGRKVYGVAKFQVGCSGLTAFANGRSWWTWTKPISVCHPGKLIRRVRFCGRLP